MPQPVVSARSDLDEAEEIALSSDDVELADVREREVPLEDVVPKTEEIAFDELFCAASGEASTGSVASSRGVGSGRRHGRGHNIVR